MFQPTHFYLGSPVHVEQVSVCQDGRKWATGYYTETLAHFEWWLDSLKPVSEVTK